MAVLKAAATAARRAGHNYICTGHLLLGGLDAGGTAAEALTALGLAPDAAESQLSAESDQGPFQLPGFGRQVVAFTSRVLPRPAARRQPTWQSDPARGAR